MLFEFCPSVGEFPRETTFLDDFVESLHRLKNDPVRYLISVYFRNFFHEAPIYMSHVYYVEVEKYELMGIVIEDNNSVVSFH